MEEEGGKDMRRNAARCTVETATVTQRCRIT